MFETIHSISNPNETLICQALNNLLVLSREDAGAEGILNYDSNLQQCQIFLQQKERTIVLGTLRLLSSLVKNSYKRVRSLKQ